MNKRKWIIFVVTLLIVVGITIGAGFAIRGVTQLALKISIQVFANLSIGIISYIAIKLSKMEIDFHFKNGYQYLIGIGICLGLSLVIAWIPALCGCSLVGGHEDFILWKFFYQMVFYILIIGPVEELLFRVYVQNTFTDLFEKNKWIGVLIASAIFGLWHIINGSLLQVLFTFGIGCVFGFTKLYIKKLNYPGVALSHGLYDFLNYVVCLAIV